MLDSVSLSAFPFHGGTLPASGNVIKNTFRQNVCVHHNECQTYSTGSFLSRNGLMPLIINSFYKVFNDQTKICFNFLHLFDTLKRHQFSLVFELACEQSFGISC